MHIDPKFNCLETLIVGTDLKTTAARDHVLGIESQIQVVKKRMQAVHGGLPYELMTSLMTIELGNYVVMMINAFPQNLLISHTYSPRTIMTVNQLYFKKQCWFPFGAYVQYQDNRSITNQTIDWTQGVVCLGPTRNLQGSYTFLSLRSGRNITCSWFT